MADTAPPLVLAVIHFSTCAASILFGTILFTITLTSASKNMESYAILLRCVTLAEMSTSIGAFMVFPRIVPLGMEAAGCIFSGPVTFLFSDDRFWFLFYALELHGTVQYNVFMTVCFCYRYYVLRKPPPSLRKTRIFATSVFAFSFVIFIMFCFSYKPLEITLPVLLQYLPQYVVFQDHFVGIINVTHSFATPAIVWTMITASAQSFVNIAVGRVIFKFLNDQSHSISEKVRQTHRQFAVALALQAVIGQLIAFSAWSYGMGQLDIIRSLVLEYSAHMVHEICVSASPIITLCFVKPYRRQLISWFSENRTNMKAVTVSQSLGQVSKNGIQKNTN